MEKLMKEIHSCIPSQDLSPGSSASAIPFCYQELIRSRGLTRVRIQHIEIQFLNIP